MAAGHRTCFSQSDRAFIWQMRRSAIAHVDLDSKENPQHGSGGLGVFGLRIRNYHHSDWWLICLEMGMCVKTECVAKHKLVRIIISVLLTEKIDIFLLGLPLIG